MKQLKVLLLVFGLLFCCFEKGSAKVYDVPYNNYLTNQTNANVFTVIDSNQDGTTWKYQQDGSCYNCYSKRKDADDWLITPGINLEAGVTYLFNMRAYVNATANPALLDVYVGKSASATLAMSEVILSSVNVTKCGSRPFENKSFTVAESGVYYFGIHNISNAGASVNIEEVHVNRGLTADSPGSISSLRAIPDPEGYLKATIKFKAPSRTYANTDIPADTQIDYMIDKKIIGSSLPGQNVELEASVSSSGDHEFSIVPYIGENPGPEARVKEYVGVDYPAQVKNINIKVVSDGILFSWDPVGKTGPFGHPVRPEEVTYYICAVYMDSYWFDFGTIGKDIQDTTYFFLCDPSEWFPNVQDFFIISSNEKGDTFSDIVTIDFTGLSIVTDTPPSDNSAFDLMGHKLDASTSKGLMIKDGKVILVK